MGRKCEAKHSLLKKVLTTRHRNQMHSLSSNGHRVSAEVRVVRDLVGLLSPIEEYSTDPTEHLIAALRRTYGVAVAWPPSVPVVTLVGERASDRFASVMHTLRRLRMAETDTSLQDAIRAFEANHPLNGDDVSSGSDISSPAGVSAHSADSLNVRLSDDELTAQNSGAASGSATVDRPSHE